MGFGPARCTLTHPLAPALSRTRARAGGEEAWGTPPNPQQAPPRGGGADLTPSVPLSACGEGAAVRRAFPLFPADGEEGARG